MTSKTEVTLQTEMTAHIMSSKTNTSAVKNVQSARKMDVDNSMTEGEGLNINSLR